MAYLVNPHTRILFALFSGIAALSGVAQTRFNYQAVLRNAGDSVVPGEPVELRFTVRRGSATGTDSYREVHAGLETSAIGYLNVQVGDGTTIELGNLDTIAWGSAPYWLKVDAFLDGAWTDLGASSIVSVPIAEYAKNGGKPWRLNPSGIHYNEGNVGIGDTLPAHPLSVRPRINIAGDPNAPTHSRLDMRSPNINNDNWISSYDEVDSLMWRIRMGDRSDLNSFALVSAVADEEVLTYTTGGVAEFRAPASSTKIRLYAGSSSLENRIASHDENGNERWRINMLDQGDGDSFAIYSNDYGGSPLRVRDDGRVQAFCLEIMGGCDINERFNSTEMLEPGTVVIADPDRPGEVKTTSETYDARVLGVISGANGIKPGITLSQENVLDGTHPLALSGRVYVKVTGPVKVGDLLTTSDQPGFAMAVTDRERAFGAVIGKALESDADGDGFVMMLVQPR